MSRGCPRLSVRVEPALLERVTETAHRNGVPVSAVLRTSVAIYTQDVVRTG
jgi:hypothetical protein